MYWIYLYLKNINISNKLLKNNIFLLPAEVILLLYHVLYLQLWKKNQ